MSLFFNPTVPAFGQNPFPQWQREMNDLFEKLNRDLEMNRLAPSAISPSVELVESEKAYQVLIEIPGMNENDFKVSLKDNRLVVEGKRKQVDYGTNFQVCTTEFSYGDIFREVVLSEEVNANTIKATYHDGILKIVLEKLEPGLHQVKRIPIQKS